MKSLFERFLDGLARCLGRFVAHIEGPSGNALGRGAARAVAFAQKAVGAVGWLMTVLVVSTYVTRGDFLRNTSWPDQVATVAPWAGMLALSIWLRRPGRWLEEMGLKLGSYSTLGFAGLAVCSSLSDTDPRERNLIGGCLILCAEICLALFALAALRHKEQVVDALRKVRRYLNGVRAGEGDAGWADHVLDPLIPFAAILTSTYFAIHPAGITGWLTENFQSLGAGETRALAQTLNTHPVASLARPLPPILFAHRFWLGISLVCEAWFYVALRRVGMGDFWRGLCLWLFSLGEIAGSIAVLIALAGQLYARTLEERLTAAGFALAALAFIWFCDRRRRVLAGLAGDRNSGL